MICLLRVGFDEEESRDSAVEATSDRFGIYRIERRDDGSLWELGRGGMGVTYRAIDTSLERTVALKLIDSEWVKRGEEARERFMREARVAAALRHPNVATVYHFGIREETGQCFCAMELVEGETLETRVRRTGPLDARTAVEIALQIASALGAAEKQGLVHRDLKPGNLMIAGAEAGGAEAPPSKGPGSRMPAAETEIVVKVIDFGVAKALAEKPDAMGLTHGGFVGTPAFASPEQFTNAPVDVRSDIYSLGATLWYLLTGRMPFAGASLTEIRAAQQSHALPLGDLRAARVPRCLVSLLVAMLDAQPAARPGIRPLTSRLEACRAQLLDRWRTARRLALSAAIVALGLLAAMPLSRRTAERSEAVRATAETVSDKSIAVLPFTNLSGDQSNTYFADGIQDEILTTLAKLADVKVISRTSVMQFRNTETRNLREIARQLGVAHVLEGSVQRADNRVRVTAQLIDARTDDHVWAERYDGELADVFTIQSQIAQKIAGQLKAALSPDERAALVARPTQDTVAYELYLRARELHRDGGAGGIMGRHALQEIPLLEEAVARDPAFVPALCLLSRAHLQVYWYTEDHTPARLELARKPLEAATRLQPENGEVHLARALFHFMGHRAYSPALTELALAANGLPNNATILYYISDILRRQGLWEESIRTMERALVLDPRNGVFTLSLVHTYRRLRRYDEARRALENVLAWKGEDVGFRFVQAEIDIQERGDLRRLEEILGAAVAASADPNLLVIYRFMLADLQRDYRTAEKALAEYGSWQMSHGFNTPREYLEGMVARGLGEQDRARAAFVRARERAAPSVAARPDDPKALMVLAKIDAKLGRKDEAVRAAERAVELLPVSVDSYEGPQFLPLLVQVYADVGETDRAMEVLQRAVALPGGPSHGFLQLDAEYDPLRHDERFQKIVASLAPADN